MSEGQLVDETQIDENEDEASQPEGVEQIEATTTLPREQAE